MSYGEYAHRGAYPLVATALLAALFVLIVTRRGGPGERSAHLRQLLYLWVGQNVLLVASSALRNARYVEVYGLTEWRIAAFIWMALVAAGLTFIIVRFVQGRTLGWLVTANAALLAGVLYACCFVNFPHLIASHNLANWQGVKDGGSILDLNHLRRLGPRALPAILAFRAKHPKTTPFHDRKLAQVSFLLKPSAKSRLRSDWRSWGFAMQRLNWQIDRLHADCCPRISRRHPARRAP